MYLRQAAVPVGLVVGLAAIVAVVAVACGGAPPRDILPVDGCVAGTPSASSYGLTINDPLNQPDLIRAYGNRMLTDGAPPNGRFNASPDPDHDLAVMLPGPVNQRTFRYGPKGEVQAERCSHRNEKPALQEGRVVMRVQIRQAGRPWPIPTEPGYHKRVNGRLLRYFEPGWSYVWIDQYADSLDTDGNLVGATARAVIVSANPNTTHVNVRKVFIELHHVAHSTAYGLWRTTPDDDHAWSTCWEYGCCEVLGDE